MQKKSGSGFAREVRWGPFLESWFNLRPDFLSAINQRWGERAHVNF
jgi:hypothetical protein